MRPKKISDADILQITRECLLEQGVGVSTNIIANRLNVSQATLFKRFGTKQNLIQKALMIAPQQFLLALESAPTKESVQNQLHKICMMMLNLYDEILPLFSIRYAGGLHQLNQEICNRTDNQELPIQIRVRLALTQWISILQQQKPRWHRLC